VESADDEWAEGDGAARAPVVTAVASWPAHGRWVSGVELVGADGSSSLPSLAVTSSDDGSLAAWALAPAWRERADRYRAAVDGGEEGDAEDEALTPAAWVERAAVAAPHGGSGLYSLSVRSGGRGGGVWAASSGKDGSLAVSTLSRGGGEWAEEWAADGAHAGVAKAVSWRQCGSVLASAGNDRTVRLWDVRAPAGGGAVARFGSEGHVGLGPDGGGLAHLLAVNKLCWTSSGVLVSGSFDNTVALWDPRREAAPLAVVRTFGPAGQALSGVAGRPKRAGGMLQPLLLADGAAVAVGVDRSTRLRVISGSGVGAPVDVEVALECGTAASDGVSRIAVAKARDVLLFECGRG